MVDNHSTCERIQRDYLKYNYNYVVCTTVYILYNYMYISVVSAWQ